MKEKSQSFFRVEVLGRLAPILGALALFLGGCCGGFLHIEPIPTRPHRIVITNVGEVVYEPVIGAYDQYDPCIVYLEQTGSILVTERRPTYLGTAPPQCYPNGYTGYTGYGQGYSPPGRPFISRSYRNRSTYPGYGY